MSCDNCRPKRRWNSSYDLAGNRTLLTGTNIGSYYQFFTYDLLGERPTIAGSANTTSWFGYDDLGRRMGLGQGPGTVVAASTYGYDAVSRITSVGHDLTGTSGDLTLGFSYNPAGQITQTTRSNDSYAWQRHYNFNRGYTANGLNQYSASGSVTPTYDANGNLTGDGSSTFAYDDENHLVSASGAASATLAYDPLGRLWQVSSSAGTTRFVYDGDRLTAEYDGSGVLLRTNTFGPGVDEPLAVHSPGVGPRFLKADERGSIVALVDSSGNAVATDSYDEHGIPGSGFQGRFGYTGQAWIPELGLWYYKARFYSPTMGRFMQTDPIGYGDGMNWYNYVGSDPLNLVDPSGLAGEDDPIVVTGHRGRCQAGYIQVGESACVFASATSQIVYSGNTYSFNVPGIPEIAPGVPCTAVGNRLTCTTPPPPAPPPPPAVNRDYCDSAWHKTGDMFSEIGETVEWGSLAAAAMGGPEFLTGTEVGGGLSTAGDAVSALTGDPRAQMKTSFSLSMMGVGGIFTPRSVKDTLIQGIIRASVDKAGLEAINRAMGPPCRG